MKVENMKSLKSYREIANQFKIYNNGIKYFQSYDTVIVKINRKGEIFLDHAWDCSNTTSRYRAIYLGETTAETRKKIEKGNYKVTDLNKEK
jgi:hypothetical protein